MATRAEDLIRRTLTYAGPIAAVPLGALATLRQGRAFHPTGTAFTGTWEAADETIEPLVPARPWPVVVRLSKGVGLPGRLPDVLGLAVRIADVKSRGDHQDLLFASSGSSGLSQHVLAPTSDHGGAHYSTITPYRTP